MMNMSDIATVTGLAGMVAFMLGRHIISRKNKARKSEAWDDSEFRIPPIGRERSIATGIQKPEIEQAFSELVRKVQGDRSKGLRLLDFERNRYSRSGKVAPNELQLIQAAIERLDADRMR